MTLYNEHDHNAAEWLRNLAKAGEITNGTVDERDIQTILPDELAGMRRVHFFAGIGGWDLALRLAGWPEDRPVWTGSCPCQPYSSAGKGQAQKDPRHLWPDMFRLIKECRPDTIFGEQVAAAIKHGWLDGVFADLEGIGYTCGAAVIGAHSVGAPHIRQRLYWVASRGDDGRSAGHGEAEAARGEVGIRPCAVPRDSGAIVGLPDSQRDQEHQEQRESDTAERERGPVEPSRRGPSMSGRLAHDPASIGRGRRDEGDKAGDDVQLQAAGLGADGGVGDGNEPGLQGRGVSGRECPGQQTAGPGGHVGPWSDYRIIPCTDGKARRTGTRVFPLAHGIPRGMDGRGTWRKGLARGASRARVGMLKGSGNAIVPELAAEFVRAFMETEPACYPILKKEY